MSGLNTYHASNRVTSANCGYGIRQAAVQDYLTDAQVAAATTVQDLINNVNAAIVAPGAEANGQRESIVRSLREAAALGDLSDARIQAATTVTGLADLTWVSEDTDTGHLGVNVIP